MNWKLEIDEEMNLQEVLKDSNFTKLSFKDTKLDMEQFNYIVGSLAKVTSVSQNLRTINLSVKNLELQKKKDALRKYDFMNIELS